MPEVHELVLGPISCHCWNGDRTSESRSSYMDLLCRAIRKYELRYCILSMVVVLLLKYYSTAKRY